MVSGPGPAFLSNFDPNSPVAAPSLALDQSRFLKRLAVGFIRFRLQLVLEAGCVVPCKQRPKDQRLFLGRRPIAFSHPTPPDSFATGAGARGRGFSRSRAQNPARLRRWRAEVVTEKSTIIGAVAPILNEFAVRWKVMHGYGSATALHDIAETSLNDDERSLEILYIGDFDPSGMHMSEVDLPGRIEKYDGVVTITRIALTCDDVEAGGLPSFDIETKSKDPRFRWFRENYGERCWELDAMNPNDLRRRLREEIWSRIDHEAWDHCKVVEAAEKESYGRHNKAWPDIPNQDQKYLAPRDREAAP
jgi:hypothetical protein